MGYTYSKSPMEKYPIYQLGMLLSESPYGAGIFPMQGDLQAFVYLALQQLLGVRGCR